MHGVLQVGDNRGRTCVVHGRPYGEEGHGDADHDEELHHQGHPLVVRVQAVDNLIRHTQRTLTKHNAIKAHGECPPKPKAENMLYTQM